MRTGAAVLACAGLLAVAGVSAAQSPAAAAPSGPKRERELTVGGLFAGPSSMGSADAVLLGPGGQPSVTLFRTENRMGAGVGPEMALGFGLGRRTWVEADAALTWADLTTKVADDFEGASAEALRAPVIRWSVEGALLWYFHDGGKTAWFVRGSGGVMGEVSNDLSVSETGFIGSGGIGLRHWWRANGTGALKRLGLRAEFRGVVRSGGISLDDRSIRFGPAGAVHLTIGY